MPTTDTKITRLWSAVPPPKIAPPLDVSACPDCGSEQCTGGSECPGAPLLITPVHEDFHRFLARLAGQPEPGWHIPGLIPEVGKCLWHGQPRDFKSFCALEALLALAANRAPFGAKRFTPARAVKVCYFTEEDTERVVLARLRWLTAKIGAPLAEFFFLKVRKGLSFDVAKDRAYILQTLDEIGAEVAAFDPVRSYTALSDKGPADLVPVTTFLRQIQNETLAKSLLLVAHDTKPPAVATTGAERSRSQQASGGGIFSISECLVAFTKLAWNQVAAFPSDYKLSGDPKPFEVTFETEAQPAEPGDEGPRFGAWVRPVAVTKGEQDIVEGMAAQKILAFLEATSGWHSTTEVNSGAKLKKDTAGPVLYKLRDEGRVQFCTGKDAQALNRHGSAHLWSATPGGS